MNLFSRGFAEISYRVGVTRVKARDFLPQVFFGNFARGRAHVLETDPFQAFAGFVIAESAKLIDTDNGSCPRIEREGGEHIFHGGEIALLSAPCFLGTLLNLLAVEFFVAGEVSVSHRFRDLEGKKLLGLSIHLVNSE